MKAKVYLLALVIAMTVVLPVSAQVSPEKEKEIWKLLEGTGAIKVMAPLMSQIITQFRSAFSDVPQAFWDELEQEMNIDELITLILPVYDRHLTLDDLKAANAFYSSPAGKRLAEKTPILTKEGFEIGREWGGAKGQLVIQRLKEKGYMK